MKALTLEPTSFRGDPDIEELHTFFQSERQFAGDTLWTIGASLKSAYVNSFEFLNLAPVIQLWRDDQRVVQAVSRVTLAAGQWLYLASPQYRRDEIALAIIEQADAAMRLLSSAPSWRTVAHESDKSGAALLKGCGYEEDGCHSVYMVRSLDDSIRAQPSPIGCRVCLLDPGDPGQVFERGDAQTDAFIEEQPYAEVAAWMTRTIPRQLAYGAPNRHPGVIAVEPGGRVLAFADVFFDHKNKIGEFEPVGTRKQAQRRGLAKAVVSRGLMLMQEAGMRQAVVRTGFDNPAAIATYESAGFEISDQLMDWRKQR